jgi:hypothetical protein
MKPLYTQEEFNTSKSRGLLPLECVHCKKPFLITKHRIFRSLNENTKQYTSDFCSKKCQGFHSTLAINGNCKNCLKPVTRTLAEAKGSKSGNMFCNQSCAAKWNNAHKTKGTRVSKLERWLAERLPLLYPDLEFHFNRKDAINGELDIFIPSLRLAFELNGIFHYEPIYGPEKLGRMQSNDERKMLACAEYGIELCVLDVSSITYFKPTKAQRFLDIITRIVNSKLSGDLPVSLPLPSQNLVEVP